MRAVGFRGDRHDGRINQDLVFALDECDTRVHEIDGENGLLGLMYACRGGGLSLWI